MGHVVCAAAEWVGGYYMSVYISSINYLAPTSTPYSAYVLIMVNDSIQELAVKGREITTAGVQYLKITPCTSCARRPAGVE